MSDVPSAIVPTAAFISHFVLHNAVANGTDLRSETLRQAEAFGVDLGEVYPPRSVRLLSLLYCLLVFPSELWKRQDQLSVVIERARLDPELLDESRDLMVAGVLRSIRNSVSHADLMIVEGRVTFLDRRGSSDPHFELTMSFPQVTNFLLVLGRAFHEAENVKQLLKSAGRRTP